MAARMREVGLDESGLGGLAGAIREAGPEAEQHLAEHDVHAKRRFRAGPADEAAGLARVEAAGQGLAGIL